MYPLSSTSVAVGEAAKSFRTHRQLRPLLPTDTPSPQPELTAQPE